MIVRIEEFPSGKIVKHITIDISFEDGEAITKVKHDYVQPTAPVATPSYGPPYVATSSAIVTSEAIRVSIDTPNVVQPIDTIPQLDERSDVLITRLATPNVVQNIIAIPDEMRDIQF